MPQPVPEIWRADNTFEGEYATRQADVGPVTIQYTDWNPEGGRPVILIHGFNVQGHTWDPIASVLAADRRVICPDLRGHGGSGWSQAGYWTTDFASDFLTLLDQLGIGSCDLVGHSLGVRVAIAMAAERPGLANHVALSDGGPELLAAGGQKAAAGAKARLGRRGFSSPDEARALYEEMHPEWLPIFRELHVRHQLRRNWAGKYIERADPDLFWITGSAGRADNGYLWECARKVTAPVLLMWAGRGPYIDAGLVARFAEAFPHFRSIRFDSGHYIPRERPADFLAFVTAFLDDQPLPAIEGTEVSAEGRG